MLPDVAAFLCLAYHLPASLTHGGQHTLTQLFNKVMSSLAQAFRVLGSFLCQTLVGTRKFIGIAQVAPRGPVIPFNNVYMLPR